MSEATKPSILFVTGNAGKLAEVQAIVGDAVCITPLKLDLPELQGPTSEFIAREKAKTAFALANGRPVMIEDSSLSFAGMGGNLPGPYIKWFLDGVGNAGLFRMAAAMDSECLAKASCIFTIAYGPQDSDIVTLEGSVEGRIVEPRGTGGFGWDVVFAPLEVAGASNTLTYAEMTKEQKNEVSHRSKALELVKATLLGDAHTQRARKHARE